jgi:N-acyl homoserine lactone hydrolase
VRAFVFALISLVASSCAGVVPAVTLSSPGSPPSPVELEVCRLDGEIQERSQWAAIDSLSFEPWHQAISSLVIQHPRGVLVIDPAFGRQIGSDLRQAPLWFRLAFGGPASKRPIITLLEEAGIAPTSVRWVALTHAHWDHAGGLRDLPISRVFLSQAEWDQVQTFSGRVDRGAITRHFEIAAWRFTPFALDGGARDGFESSHDLFGDGSVVALPLPGHTPGSVGYLIQGKGHRWLYIGDASWTMEGITRPARKMLIASLTVDLDREKAAQTLGLLHAVQQSRPDITVVPSHDLSMLETIPRCSR